MMLTKSSNVDGLLGLTPNDRIVVSWSLNTQPMIDVFEAGTADLDERIEAARRCLEHGYRVRVRIDPGIFYPGWERDYADLVHRSLTTLEPENITLGMLRLLPGHFGLARQAYGSRGALLRDAGLADRASDGKCRYAPEQRAKFYEHLTDVILAHNRHMSISLCRETPYIWDRLRNRCDPHKCNCLAW